MSNGSFFPGATHGRRSSSLAVTGLCSTALVAAVYFLWLISAGLFAQRWFVIAIVGTKAVVEIVASFYAIVFACTAGIYLASKQETPPDNSPPTPLPRLAVVYLCCGDLDATALRSLTALRYDGDLTIIVHDDSTDEADREAVDAAVQEVQASTNVRVRVVRRPDKSGGKPGAVNFVLGEIAEAVDWFVLCDNDSIALDPQTLEKALRRGVDPSVAVVQFRTIGVPRPDDSRINRRLSESVDAFHLFLSVWSRLGWMPFIGHNAMLRMSAVQSVGGFTPGCFADDVDLTVRLNVAGHAVVYAPEIRMGETHPTSYASLRKRTYKWAYGCMQVLKAHARRVLTSPRLSIAEKVGFLQFAGFYVGQALLLGYLVLAFVVSPFVLSNTGLPLVPGIVLGSGMIVGIFLPVLAYFARERRLVRSLGVVLLFALAYGTSDFVCVSGLWDAARNRVRRWVPTNVSSSDRGESILFAEALFGALLLAVPLAFLPQLLWVPSAYLFAGKFLFAPTVGRWYHHDWRWHLHSRRRFAAATTAAIVVTMVAVLPPAVSGSAAPSHIEIRGKNIFLDGGPFLVKGVHYGPWPPGTGPGKQYSYPDRVAIDRDLTLLAQLHANTILIFDAPDYVLDVAQAHGLHVIYTFNINWWSLPLDNAARERILDRVRALRDKPALLAWILGNEVPSAVLDTKGAEVVTGELRDLYQRIKAVDPHHPVSHSNWVTTKDLDLSFLDFASFNVYPLWPPQVVALGYDGYLRRILRPIVGDKALLITEFGVNTLEAGEEEQGAILARTWQALRTTDAAGGVVMEFADEWWKNYDNPRNPRDWWDRAFASDDELRHDNDPEEYYGIVNAERQPKPAFAVVQRMFSTEERRSNALIPTIIAAVLVQTSVIGWIVAWRAQRRRSRTHDE